VCFECVVFDKCFDKCFGYISVLISVLGIEYLLSVFELYAT